MRSSNRIKAKLAQNDGKSKEEQEKDSIRFIYGQDMNNCQLAFVRILNDDMVPLPDEMRGVLHVGSLPEKKGTFDWGTVSVFNNEYKVCIVDSFGLMNDDKQYRLYMESIPDDEWEDKQLFIDEYMKVGRDAATLEKNAYKKGRIDGIKEACAMMTKQILIYLCLKMKSTLTEPVVKRGAVQKSYEHLPLFAFNQKGCDLIEEMAALHTINGNTHCYEDIDWDVLVEHVGIDSVAKKISNKLYYYGDVLKFTYNEDSHLWAIFFVGTRWNGKDHRHRNIPTLFNNN